MIDIINKNNLQLNKLEGLIHSCPFVPSPHCDDRPFNYCIDMIVIHCISLPPGQFGGDDIEAFFTGELNDELHPYYQTITHLKVSSHLLIKRNGHVIQFVPFSKRAWHAGESFFQGKSACNDFSIGIELEGADTHPYEKVQYQQLIAIVSLLMQAYPTITLDRIVGHEEIAPKRKTDPGPFFDWGYLRNGLIEGSR